ncbi:hypothetical protein CR513_54953, partial [Mucuna pruriens]
MDDEELMDEEIEVIEENSGNIHNFLDLELAKKMGCKLDSITLMIVIEDGGTKLEVAYTCKGIYLAITTNQVYYGRDSASFDGKRFVLQGAKPSSIKLINNKSFT